MDFIPTNVPDAYLWQAVCEVREARPSKEGTIMHVAYDETGFKLGYKKQTVGGAFAKQGKLVARPTDNKLKDMRSIWWRPTFSEMFYFSQSNSDHFYGVVGKKKTVLLSHEPSADYSPLTTMVRVCENKFFEQYRGRLSQAEVSVGVKLAYILTANSHIHRQTKGKIPGHLEFSWAFLFALHNMTIEVRDKKNKPIEVYSNLITGDSHHNTGFFSKLTNDAENSAEVVLERLAKKDHPEFRDFHSRELWNQSKKGSLF